MWVDAKPWFTIWRAAFGRQVVLIQRPESLLQTLPVELDESGQSSLVTSEGRCRLYLPCVADS